MGHKECCKGERHWRCSFWKCLGWGVLAVIGFSLLILLFGALIMWLWNCIVPSVFHLTSISFGQAVGLAILGRLLFGGFGHKWHHGRMKGWKHSHGCCGSDCNCKSDENKDSGCCSHSDKWQHYDKYWEEEGEKSYNDYVKRRSENA